MTTFRDRWLEPEILADPYAYMEELRNESPVYFSDTLGGYLVTRYADVTHVLREPDTFASNLAWEGDHQANFDPAFASIYAAAGVPQLVPTLQSTDGAIHRRYRTMVDSTFSPAMVRALEQDIKDRVNALIDAIIERGSADMYSDFCALLPLYVICDLAGIPTELTPHLRASANAMVRLIMPAFETPESLLALHRDQAEFQQAIMEVIGEFRRKPNEQKLISRLIHTPTQDGDHLSDQEVMSLVTVLNVGGNETTTNGLANMFHLCFSEPGCEDRLRDDKAAIDRFVEEALRMESPVSCIPRRVTRDTAIQDVHIPRGSLVFVNFGAANRDERMFACPYMADTDRSGIRNHLAFGVGKHFCLGAILSRLEMSLSMAAVLDRMQNIHIDVAVRPPKREEKISVRSFDCLPITFEVRDAELSSAAQASR